MDVLEGRVLNLAFLRECADTVRGKYEPKVLILSQEDFRGHMYAATIHNCDVAIKAYKDLGIERIVWATDLDPGEFLLSSGKGLEEGIETMVL